MTKEEALHLGLVQEFGCIACRASSGVFSPAEIHHILDGNRRLGHFHVLPLCVPHHRGGSDGISAPFVSRHPYKKRFELAYGTEADLLEIINSYIELQQDGLHE